MHTIGFTPGAPAEQLDRIFQNVVLPNIVAGKEDDDQANFALLLETLTYEVKIKQSETEEEFHNTYAFMQPSLTAIGKRAFEKWRIPDLPGPQPIVGFFLPGPARLAHTDQLITLLTALKALPVAPIRPVVIVASAPAGELPKIMQDLGYPLVFLGEHGQPTVPLDLIRRLRDAGVKQSLDALVFVSTPVNMVSMVAAGVAPVTLWWSMKWYSLAVPGLDERLTPRRGDSIELGGYTWRCGHVCLPQLATVEHAKLRERMRTVWKIDADQVVYGWLGREEKLSLEYADAIATLLEANPRAIFVYGGKTRRPDFEAKLKDVAHQCRHIGWVDVGTCIWAFDVYADSFPMGSGHTAFAAMQAGIPVVTLHTPENEQNSAAAHFIEILAGPDAGPAHKVLEVLSGEFVTAMPMEITRGDFHMRLCSLGQDAKFRKVIGEKQQMFVQKFLMESELYARKTSAIIVEAIARKHGLPLARLAPPDIIPAHAPAEAPPKEEAAAGSVAPGAGPVEDSAGVPEGPRPGSQDKPDGPRSGGRAKARNTRSNRGRARGRNRSRP